ARAGAPAARRSSGALAGTGGAGALLVVSCGLVGACPLAPGRGGVLRRPRRPGGASDAAGVCVGPDRDGGVSVGPTRGTAGGRQRRGAGGGVEKEVDDDSARSNAARRIDDWLAVVAGVPGCGAPGADRERRPARRKPGSEAEQGADAGKAHRDAGVVPELSRPGPREEQAGEGRPARPYHPAAGGTGEAARAG